MLNIHAPHSLSYYISLFSAQSNISTVQQGIWNIHVLRTGTTECEGCIVSLNSLLGEVALSFKTHHSYFITACRAMTRYYFRRDWLWELSEFEHCDMPRSKQGKFTFSHLIKLSLKVWKWKTEHNNATYQPTILPAEWITEQWRNPEVTMCGYSEIDWGWRHVISGWLN